MKKGIFEHLYFLFWMLLAASIPLSKFATSVFMFAVFGSWFLSSWDGRLALFKKHGLMILLGSGLFLVFFVGLWNTENFVYAVKDLKVKLPLLVFPIVLFTGPKFNKNHVLGIFSFLSAGAFLSALIGYLYYQSFTVNVPGNFRAMSPFISHIRLSLMLCFSLVYCYYLLLSLTTNLKWFLLIPCAFMFFYLSEIQSLTALVILPLTMVTTLLFFPPWKQSKKLGRIISIAFVAIIIMTGYAVQQLYQEEFKDGAMPASLAEFTVNGNPYTHDLGNLLVENGNFVGLYYCEPELYSAWDQVSEISLDSLVSGYPLKVCLGRYLTSRNYRKDSVGVSKLTGNEVRAIENGVANYKLLDGNGIRTRLRTTLWEIKRWKDKGTDYESSVTMRFFLWDNAKQIIKLHLWTGVGVGDVEDELKKQYGKSVKIEPNKLKRTHNQYFAVAIAVGFIGLMFFVFLFLYPFVIYNGPFRFLYIMIGVILCCSMFWEDTIETQAGVALFGLLIQVPFAQYLREKESAKAS